MKIIYDIQLIYH